MIFMLWKNVEKKKHFPETRECHKKYGQSSEEKSCHHRRVFGAQSVWWRKRNVSNSKYRKGDSKNIVQDLLILKCLHVQNTPTKTDTKCPFSRIFMTWFYGSSVAYACLLQQKQMVFGLKYAFHNSWLLNCLICSNFTLHAFDNSLTRRTKVATCGDKCLR